jgi:GNAT superfamily N-acetyltransferase
MRFFSAGVNLRDAARWAADVEGQDRFGLVALHGAAKAIVGHAVYVRTEAAQAEVAFEVLDAWQGKGLATILLGQLAEAAEQRGIDVFSAEVMPSNHRMLEIFRESGFSPIYRSGSGSVRIEFPVTLSAEGQERYERREQIAASAALRSFLRPASIAVIGASRRRGTIGGEIFHNLLSAGFPGPVYPVNPTAGVVQSVMAYPRSRTSRAPWSSPSWPYRLPRSPASSASAPRRASGPSSSSPQASRRAVTKEPRASTSWWRSAGTPGCG